MRVLCSEREREKERAHMCMFACAQVCSCHNTNGSQRASCRQQLVLSSHTGSCGSNSDGRTWWSVHLPLSHLTSPTLYYVHIQRLLGVSFSLAVQIMHSRQAVWLHSMPLKRTVLRFWLGPAETGIPVLSSGIHYQISVREQARA